MTRPNYLKKCRRSTIRENRQRILTVEDRERAEWERLHALARGEVKTKDVPFQKRQAGPVITT